MSLPPREAWIEIIGILDKDAKTMSLPPREAWIEINLDPSAVTLPEGRFPRGKRGLKLQYCLDHCYFRRVASPAGSVD